MADTKLKLNWQDGTAGGGTLKGPYLDTGIAIPESLGGSGKGTEPKELLVSSAATCYIATLTSILENRKLPVEEHTMDSEVFSLADKSMKIVHKPKVVLSADATDHQIGSAERAMEGADRACPIGNLLKNAGITIELQPEVSTK